MTYRVNDSTQISISIAGKELTLGFGNALHTLHIVASTQLTVPTIKFNFTDTLGEMSLVGLNDGALVEVMIRGTITVNRRFRVYSWQRAPAGNGFSYVVEGIWDCPQYFLGTENAGMRGSSTDVLQRIGAKCSLKWYDKNTATSDSMLWMPSNKTYGQFARNVARHGYVNGKSHMVYGIDTQGAIRYIDVNANPKPVHTVGYLTPGSDPNFHVLSDFHPSSRSGLNNTLLGYRHDRYRQSAVDDPEKIDALVLESDSKYPSVNSDVRTSQARGTISYSGIDFGNVHPKYEQARYQNSRYDFLNSIQGEFLFPYQTNWEIGDNFNYVGPSEMNNKMYDGEFTVTTKVVFINASHYQEKVVAVKNGLEG